MTMLKENVWLALLIAKPVALTTIALLAPMKESLLEVVFALNVLILALLVMLQVHAHLVLVDSTTSKEAVKNLAQPVLLLPMESADVSQAL